MNKNILEVTEDIYKYLLKSSLLKPIRKIGKCKIYNDRIVCLVDGKKLKKNCDSSYCYRLFFYGIFSKNELELKKYQLDKPVQYIIENVDFDKNICINSYDSEIIFRNCSFSSVIDIKHAFSITFENNKYKARTLYDFTKNKMYSKFYILTKDIENVECIKFVNDNICITSEKKFDNIKQNSVLMRLDLFAKNIEIVNTKIDEKNSTIIESDKIIIKNSVINSNEFYVTSNCIEKENNIFNIKEGIISGENVLSLNSINNQNIYYKDKEKLQKLRELLINKLKQVEEQYNNHNSEKVITFSKNIKAKKKLKKVK